MNTAPIPMLLAPRPFTPEVAQGTLLAGQTIAQGLAAACNAGIITLDDVPFVRVYVMGEPLPHDLALDYVPVDGEVINVVVEPQGGDTGRTIFQLFYTIGAAVVGFYFGPVWGAVVALAGTVATNLIWSPSQDRLPDGMGRSALTDSGNQARLREMMPLVLGRRRVELDLAARPYSQNIGSDVWFTVAFGVHYGACTADAIKLGETLLADYPAGDWQLESFLQPGPRDSSLYPSRVVQENLQDQLDFTGGGVWEVHTATAGAAQIEVDIALPGGLKFNSDSGKIRNEEVSGRIEFAPVGTEDWQPVPTITGYRNKDNQLLPTGTWYINARTNDAIRRTFAWQAPDPSVQYKVRTKAWDADGDFPDDQGHTWDTYWTALRSVYREPAFLDENLSVLVLRIKSSDDLNGSLPTVSALVEPIYPVFDADSGTWGDPQPTSNPAALLRGALTGPAPAVPLTDDEVNETFDAHYQLVEERGWHGAYALQGDVTQEEMLIALGRMGRFSAYWNGEQLCLVPDWEKPIAKQLFTGRNVEGYRYQRTFPDPIHAVLIEYRNSEQDDRGDELWVYADGYGPENTESFVSARIDFSCTPARAYREGRVYLAKYQLQIETHEWTAGADAVVATFGDRVRVRHSVGLIGQTEARVQFRRWQGGVAGGLVTGLRLDSPVTMEAGKTYAMDARPGDEDPGADLLLDMEVLTQPGTGRDVVFPVALAPGACPAVGDLVAFGEQGLVTEDLEVVDIRPQGDSAKFYAQRYLAAEIEAAETGAVPDLPTTLQPVAQAPVPRFIGNPVGAPAGVRAAFDISPVRADQVAGFSVRMRQISDAGSGDWTTLDALPPSARQIITPPFDDAAVTDEDGEPEYLAVQLEIRTVMRSGPPSRAATSAVIIVSRSVAEPIDFTAVGVVRVNDDGGSFGAIAVSAQPVTSGTVQTLEVTVRPVGSTDDTLWTVPTGGTLSARTPRGDLLGLVSGAPGYDVRARWISADNWQGPAVIVPNVVVPAGSNVADDVSPFAPSLQPFRDQVDLAMDNAANLLREVLRRRSRDRGDRTAMIDRQDLVSQDLVRTRETLEIADSDNLALLEAESLVRLTADQSETSIRTTQISALGISVAAVQTLSNTNATNLAAETLTRTTQISNLGNSLAIVESQASTTASALLAETNTRTTQISSLNGTVAAYGSSITTNTNGISALVSQYNTLSVTVGNQTGLIQTAQTVATDAQNRVYALWGLYLDVNGYVSGFQNVNNGVFAAFTVRSDAFQILAPGGGARTIYQDGIWRAYPSGDATRSMWGKPFGGADGLTWWTGPDSVPLGSESKANAFVYISINTVNGPRFGGSDVAGGTAPLMAVPSADLVYGYNPTGGYVTTSSVTIYPSIGGGTIRWLNSDGDATDAEPTSGSSFTTAFAASAPYGSMRRAIFVAFVRVSGQSVNVVIDAQFYGYDPNS